MYSIRLYRICGYYKNSSGNIAHLISLSRPSPTLFLTKLLLLSEKDEASHFQPPFLAWPGPRSSVARRCTHGSTYDCVLVDDLDTKQVPAPANRNRLEPPCHHLDLEGETATMAGPGPDLFTA